MPFTYVNTNVITNVITNVKVLPKVPFTYVNTNVITNIIAEKQQTHKRTWDSHNSSTNDPGVGIYKNQ